MSWWEAAGFSNLAQQALKTAQKKIDKVLDIQEEDGELDDTKGLASSPKKASSQSKKTSQEDNFWNSWSSSTISQKTENKDSDKKSQQWKQWNWWKDDKDSAGKFDSHQTSSESVIEEEQKSESLENLSEASSPKSLSVGPKSPTRKSTALKLGAKKKAQYAKSQVQQSDGTSSVSMEQVNAAEEMLNFVDSGKETLSETTETEKRTDEITEHKQSVIAAEENNELAEVPAKPQQIGEWMDKCLDYTDSTSENDVKKSVENFEDATDVTEEKNVSEEKIGESDGPSENIEGVNFGENVIVGALKTDTHVGSNEELQTAQEEKTDVGFSETLPIDQSDDQNEVKDSGDVSNTDAMAQAVSEILETNQEKDKEQEFLMEDISVNDQIPQEDEPKKDNTEMDSNRDTAGAGNALCVDKTEEKSVPKSESGSETVDVEKVTESSVVKEDSLTNNGLESILRDHSTSSVSTSSDTSSTITVYHNNEQKDSSDSSNSIFSDVTYIKVKETEESLCGSDGMVKGAAEKEGYIPSVEKEVNLPEGESSKLEENQKAELDTSEDTVTVENLSISETKNESVPVDCEESDKQTEATTMAQSMVSSSSSSSFVKCMIDDAMAESTKTEDLESPLSSEKSDLVKVESSQNSGHTSGDEMDTTNSSDIEILSIPTPNGDGKEKPFDLSPLRQALSRSVRSMVPGHRRNDSHDSCSSNDRQSPENLDRLDLLAGKNPDKRHGSSKGFSSDESEDPYHPQKLLKKLAETAEILEARENKLLQQSKENMDLSEENSILRNQLQQMQKSHEEELTDVTTLSEEFGHRLTEMEKKLQAAYKERDNMKRQLTSAEEELKKKIRDRQTIQLMKEKDEQIAELLEEGEKLSKQQLQSNNIIKKLRAKEKESESLIKSKKQKVEEQANEISHLKEVLDSKEVLEKKQTDAINQLNAAVQKQEKEIWKLKSELEDAAEKNRSLQSILDSSYKEIVELKKANIAKESQAQELALSTEMQAKEELRLNLEKQQQQAKLENESLMMQVEDLRLGLSRMEKEYGRREDMLRQEISDAHQRLQEAESRNNTLTQSVSVATRPLLRQIENLQSTYSAQSSSWEGLEKNLTERLHDAQSQLAVAVERERTASEKVLELQSKVSALETQNASLRQEKSRLMAQLEMEKAKVEMLEDAKSSESVQYEAMRHNLEKELAEVKKEKILVENQLEMEKLKLEAEKKKLLIAHDQLNEKELQLARQSPKAPSPAPQSASRQQSFSSSVGEASGLMQDDVLERSLYLAAANGNKVSLYESLRQSGAASVLENLQAQLKQKDGEVMHLQDEITQLERTREAMARELVELSTRNEQLEEEVKELPEIRQKFTDLDQRYNALLQMYGEKVEEADELRLDLHDVKDLYKTQIDLLFMNQSS
ncbi:TATA element modulatory factor isoform X2 [Lingula anatina]|uniref:TATA element modulatory factor isoform X2 n=1 Tax=Lingula anatina TaxID=7574 RepID=A0A1S3IXA6_LINAN|nr:TATA element modulatory factor isoform X2 [Lingula anatina]|eukprot:XP_013402837.1 TATA element modulatory factor isoform X2 [Lingula anatina]